MRLDQTLVERGLFATRARARAAILDGIVTVDGEVARKPARSVAQGARIALAGKPLAFVSRAALKLAYALDHFRIDPNGRLALDLGASTGGFVQVLIERGAARVFALDVGQGQLHESLRGDPRIVPLERLNARDLRAQHLPEAPGLVTCDVSFISLKLALPPALGLCATGAILIALIKPQFEAGPEALGKGGIVRDEAVHDRVCSDIRVWLEQEMGWHVDGAVASPITGQGGNREFLVAATKS